MHRYVLVGLIFVMTSAAEAGTEMQTTQRPGGDLSITLGDIDQMFRCAAVLVTCAEHAYETPNAAQYLEDSGRGWFLAASVHAEPLVDVDYIEGRSLAARDYAVAMHELGSVGGLLEIFEEDCLPYQSLVSKTVQELRLKAGSKRRPN